MNDLHYEEVEKPKLESGWALVEVKAAGICGSDIPRIFTTGTYHFPTIPGHEFSGIVREVFDEVNIKLVGKRVGVFPLIPCKKCDNCLKENYETCSNYDYLGSRTDGGFAEFVKVPIWNLLPLPDEITFEEAAMLEPISVALHAIKQINYTNQESAVVFGIGPIGMITAQWLKLFGIKQILLIANKKEQVQLANKLGFTDVCNVKEQDAQKWIQGKTEGRGVAVAVEGVGTSQIMEQCIQSLRAKGSLLLLANPKDDLYLDKNKYWQILRKQLTVYGTWNSRYGTTGDDNWKETIQALKDKRLIVTDLITHKIEFDKLMDALLLMKDKKEFYCKIMITR